MRTLRNLATLVLATTFATLSSYGCSSCGDNVAGTGQTASSDGNGEYASGGNGERFPSTNSDGGTTYQSDAGIRGNNENDAGVSQPQDCIEIVAGAVNEINRSGAICPGYYPDTYLSLIADDLQISGQGVTLEETVMSGEPAINALDKSNIRISQFTIRGYQTGIKVWRLDFDSTRDSGVFIEDNYIAGREQRDEQHGAAEFGISVANINKATILRNTVDYCEIAIQYDSASYSEVAYNVLHAGTYESDGQTYRQGGIGLWIGYINFPQINIHDNTVSEFSTALSFGGLESTITNNVFTNNYLGIDLGSGERSTIAGNTITENDKGLRVGGCSNTIRDNDLRRNVQTIEYSSGGSQGCNTVMNNQQ